MKKRTSVLLAAALTLLAGGCDSTLDLTEKEAVYCVTYTQSFERKGKCFLIDENGKRLSSEWLPMQDLSRYYVTEDVILLSGHRKNNTAVFHKGERMMDRSFLFLNKSEYSGVNALTLDQDGVLGIMNGNYRSEDGVYLNLLVLQSLEGEVLQQTILETFARSVLSEKGQAVVAGARLDIRVANEEDPLDSATPEEPEEKEKRMAQIAVCELDPTPPASPLPKTPAEPLPEVDVAYYRYEDYESIWKLVRFEDKYVCIAESRTELVNKSDKTEPLLPAVNTLLVIDPETFEIEGKTVLSDELSELIVYENALYAIGNKGIYSVDVENVKGTEKFSFPEERETFIEFAYTLGGKAYIFSRYAQRIIKGSQYEYGHVYEMDLNSFEYTKAAICSMKYETMNTIFVFPTSFFDVPETEESSRI